MLRINEVRQLDLGVQGENLEQNITIDISPWLVEFPNGSVTIWHRRNGDEVPTPTGAEMDREAGTLSWSPTSTDTYSAGIGAAEIRLTENNVVKKSRIIQTNVAPSVTVSGATIDSNWPAYIGAVDTIRAAAVVAAEDAETAQAAAETAQADAEDAQEAAETAQAAAETAQTAAETAQAEAESAAGDAAAAAAAAQTAQGKAEDAQEAAEDARDDVLGMSVSATALPSGYNPTVSYNQGHMAFGIPKGDTGAYVYIRYSSIEPTMDSDMKTTPDKYMGIYSGMAETAPVHYTDYTWYRIRGEDGTGTGFVEGIKMNGREIEMDEDHIVDLGTVITEHQSLNGKTDKVANATSGNFAGLDSNGNLTDSGSKASDFLTEHQDLSHKADKQNTVLDTTLSRGRAANTTVGAGSVAFGNDVEASGSYSKAEGIGTIANHAYQHAAGAFNIADPSSAEATEKGTYIEIIGNGTDANNRSTARTLDWNGDERLKGRLFVRNGFSRALDETDIHDDLNYEFDDKVLSAGMGNRLFKTKTNISVKEWQPSDFNSQNLVKYTVDNGTRHLIVILAANTDTHGLFLVHVTATGSVVLTEIHSGSNLQVSTETNKLQIKEPTGTRSTRLYDMLLDNIIEE